MRVLVRLFLKALVLKFVCPAIVAGVVLHGGWKEAFVAAGFLTVASWIMELIAPRVGYSNLILAARAFASGKITVARIIFYFFMAFVPPVTIYFLAPSIGLKLIAWQLPHLLTVKTWGAALGCGFFMLLVNGWTAGNTARISVETNIQSEGTDLE